MNLFVIEWPEGLCLVDTGQTATATARGYFPSWYPFFRLSRFELGVQEEAAPQLAAAGLEPTSVRWVVLTHMHTDHVGGLEPFRGAEVIVARAEWEAAQGIRGRLRGYLPQRWPRGVHPRVADFTGPGIGPFAGSYDVAGDGRMLLVPLPGHSPGHSALLVRPSSAGGFLFAGDAALRAEELRDAAPAVDEWCAREGIVVLTAHDDAAASLLALSRVGP